MNSSKWFVIINAQAGLGKSLSKWNKFYPKLKKSGLGFDFQITDNKNHCKEALHKAMEQGYEKFLAVGGDGTLNQLLNYFLGKKLSNLILISQLPIGTGNDWVKSLNNKAKTEEEFIERLKEYSVYTYKQDFGEITFESDNSAPFYFLNMTGVGFSGKVIETVVKNSTLKRTGAFGYLIALIKSLNSFSGIKGSLKYSKGIVSEELFHTSIGIGKFAGGGMKFCPNSSSTDRLLDLTLVSKISKWKVVTNVLKLFNGSFIKLPEVQQFRDKEFHLELNEPTPIESDGEFLGYHKKIKASSTSANIAFVQ